MTYKRLKEIALEGFLTKKIPLNLSEKEQTALSQTLQKYGNYKFKAFYKKYCRYLIELGQEFEEEEEDNPEFNSFNSENTIELFSNKNQLIKLISQKEAFRLLTHNQAKLILKYPPAIQLIVESISLPLPLGRRTSHSKADIYGNYLFRNVDGKDMFYIGNCRTLWYLNRNLVTIISEEPPILQFKNETNGVGHNGDKFYLTQKENCCVICGARKKLNRHHIVPFCFRKFLPVEQKSNCYHDILLCCVDCHRKYELFADQLKKELAEKYNTKIIPNIIYDKELSKAVSASTALLKNKDKIPESRKNELFQTVKEYLKIENVSEKQLLTLAKKRKDIHIKQNDQSFGEIIVKQVNFQEFTEMWRNHFISNMKPQFMPEHWDITKCYYRKEKLG